MNKIVASFESQTPLWEIVKNSQPGTLFFQNHDHAASYQLIIQSLDELTKNKVKHCYLEISTLFNELLAEHRSGKKESLDSIIDVFIDPIPKTYLKKLIEKAHSVGIQVLAVDPSKPGLNIYKSIGNEEEQKKLIQLRTSFDAGITKNIRNYTKLLGKNEKFIGLFGSKHISICNKSHLNIPSVLFQSHDAIDNCFENYKPSELEAQTEEVRTHLDMFDIIVVSHNDLEDKIDMTKEVSDGTGIKLLNQFLSINEIPISCKGYAHTNSTVIDGVVFVETKNSVSTWNKILNLMGPIGKRIIPGKAQTTMIFHDVEREKTCFLLLQGILAKKKLLQMGK